MNRLLIVMSVSLGMAVCARQAMAAVGCTLKDPDRDIQRIFPEATGYKTEFITVKEHGGATLLKEIEQRLGDKLDPVYEGLDLPYAFYTVLKGKAVIGRVHGVNQKGKYGGMQLILATTPEGVVAAFYYQKLSSPDARHFRKASFLGQFKGLTLRAFHHHWHGTARQRNQGQIAKIKDPSTRSAEDFKATLRGLTKNLILLDLLFLDRKYEKEIRKEDRQRN